MLIPLTTSCLPPSSSSLGHSCGAASSTSEIGSELGERRRVAAKLRAIEAQLRQAQRMEAIADLAGGVAHDFNNLLSIILTYSKMLLAELPAEDRLVPDLEQIDKAAERAARLTKQLLAFSRQQLLEPQVLDLNRVARGLEQALRRLLGEQIRLSLLEGPNLQRIFADAGQLEQVLINLVMNARDAMPDGGSLTIETANVELDGASPEQHRGVPPGSYVMVAVADTGVGMDAKTAARIFEPFFTTKAKDKGTGLGLSTVYGIVRQSNGYLSTHSEPGAGTTLKVYFPRSDVNGHPSASAPAPSMLGATETVLLVDSDDSRRVCLRANLLELGYHVLQAASGEEGLSISEQYRGDIELLLTDLVVPRMTGKNLAEHVGRLRSDLKVLYLSADTEGGIVHQGALEPDIAYLAQPVTLAALARKLREVLHSDPTTAVNAGPTGK